MEGFVEDLMIFVGTGVGVGVGVDGDNDDDDERVGDTRALSSNCLRNCLRR
jgi:hypothetical protein